MTDTQNDVIEIPPLTDAYHKARRQLGLFSAILIFWEYVGIKIGDVGSKIVEKGTQEVTAKLPQTDLKITIMHPEGIPLIIFLLVIYFSVRLFIEWYQCNSERRALKVSIIDFALSFSLAFIATAIFIIQKLSNVRVADIISQYFFSFQLGAFIAFAAFILSRLRIAKGIDKIVGIIIFLSHFFYAVFIAIVKIHEFDFSDFIVVISMFIFTTTLLNISTDILGFINAHHKIKFIKDRFLNVMKGY